jgi:hypothetical protein
MVALFSFLPETKTSTGEAVDPHHILDIRTVVKNVFYILVPLITLVVV